MKHSNPIPKGIKRPSPPASPPAPMDVDPMITGSNCDHRIANGIKQLDELHSKHPNGPLDFAQIDKALKDDEDDEYTAVMEQIAASERRDAWRLLGAAIGGSALTVAACWLAL